MNSRGTIFVHEENFLAGKPCFGVRFDCQKLPSGCYVVGFLLAENDGVKELIDTPSMDEIQRQNFEVCIAYSRAVLLGQPWEQEQNKLEQFFTPTAACST